MDFLVSSKYFRSKGRAYSLIWQCFHEMTEVRIFFFQVSVKLDESHAFYLRNIDSHRKSLLLFPKDRLQSPKKLSLTFSPFTWLLFELAFHGGNCGTLECFDSINIFSNCELWGSYLEHLLVNWEMNSFGYQQKIVYDYF